MISQSKSYKEWYDENIKDKKSENEYSHRYYCNHDCEFFPCHNDIKEEDFNCLTCYCPLMAQENCIGIQNGDAQYLANGWKDCSGCSIFHDKNNYDLLMEELTKFYSELFNN
jgi:Zn-finger protein